MQMVSARLKMLELRVHILFVMTMELIRMKHGCMGTGFIGWTMAFIVMK